MANRVKTIRQDLFKVSRKELAELLNITSAAISNYENDLRDPEIEVSYRMITEAQIRGHFLTLDAIYLPSSELPENSTVRTLTKD